jgi:hypothetical protein
VGPTIYCRSDLSGLQLKHREEFDKFHRLRIEIDSPNQADPSAELNTAFPREGPENNKYNYQKERDKRTQTAHELAEVLASIRELPGFEGFHSTPFQRSDGNGIRKPNCHS